MRDLLSYCLFFAGEFLFIMMWSSMLPMMPTNKYGLYWCYSCYSFWYNMVSGSMMFHMLS